MRHLAKSMLRFSLASGLFGAEQMLGLLRGKKGSRSAASAVAESLSRPTGEKEVPEALEEVTWATQAQLGLMMQAAYQAGDDLQSEWTDLLADTMTPSRWGQVASEMASRSLDALRFASPSADGNVARQELKNKYEVYWLVRGARKVLGLPPLGTKFFLEEFIARADTLDPYRALWAVEGMGHDYAIPFLTQEPPVENLLSDPRWDHLPRAHWPMLHAGLGLAISEHLLGSLTPFSSRSEVASMVDRFAEFCRANARPEFMDDALEALGLEARCFFPQLVPKIEQELQRRNDSLLWRYFWHGVGRAIYFIPVNFLPGYGSIWRAIELSQREAPHEMARHHSLAGVAFAFTLVNMSHPEILENLLRHHSEALRSTAFAEGMVASVVRRNEITPGASVLEDFLQHKPSKDVEDLWQEMVAQPCRKGISRHQLGQRLNSEVYGALARQSEDKGAGA